MKNVWKGMLAGALIGVGLDGLNAAGRSGSKAAGRLADHGKILADSTSEKTHTILENVANSDVVDKAKHNVAHLADGAIDVAKRAAHN